MTRRKTLPLVSSAFEMPRRVFHLLLALALYPLAAPAAAGETRYPNIAVDISTLEVQGDATVTSDDPRAEITDLFTKTEPAIKVALSPEWSVNAVWVLQPIRDPGPDDDRVFEDHGLFVEELHVDYETDRLAVSAGKLTPNFGKAWGAAPGVYGTDFAEGYELAERIGLAAAVTLGDDTFGNHILGASVFFLDTTLNHSLIDSRGTLGRGDGGAANTERPNSYGFFLEGEVPAPGGLGYHLAFVDQAKGRGGGADELGFAANLHGDFDLGGGLGLAPLVEFVHFANADTVDDQERTFITAGAELTYQGWSLSVSDTERITDVPTAGTENDEDSHFTISAGYAFDFGPGVNVGWKHTNAARIESETVGFLLSYEVSLGRWPE